MTLEQKITIYKEQEERLQFETFNNNDAWNIGSAIALRAIEENLPIAIDITLNGYQLFRYGCIGSNLHNDKWMKRKMNTVNTVHKSSIHAGAILALNELDMKNNWYLDPMEYAQVGGGFPIIIRGTGVVGTICVSGLPDYLDHQVIIDALEEYLGE